MKDGDSGAVNHDENKKRKPRALKKRKSPDDDSTGSLDKKAKTEEPAATTGAKRTPRSLPPPMNGSEMDFNLHVGNLGCPLMTFESGVRALQKTLDQGADLRLAEHNLSCCAECKGGGDLLCCDCCRFAFHIDCLDPAERGSFLYVPYQKYGLRHQAAESARPDDSQTVHTLEEHEWFCPYCLSLPIQRHWKRGPPQFLQTFTGFNESYRSSESAQSGNNQLNRWRMDVERFVNDTERLEPLEAFPSSILLALSGIRRLVQRLGPTFQQETKAEVERLEQFVEAQGNSPVIDEDVAEPVNVKDESAAPKTTIMHGGVKKQALDPPKDQPPSDEAVSESDALRASNSRSRPRRTRAKPIVPTADNYSVSDNAEAARMNVGGSFQVPSSHKFYTEALELGCDYRLTDQYSVFARLPADTRAFVPLECIPAKKTCRLVYSQSQWKQRRASLENLPDTDTRKLESAIPLSPAELTLYIRQVLHSWPAWIQWPASQEYALKILHHCQYNAQAALRLLCSEGMQFIPICDPPLRPYMNKWRPRDKRGLIPTIPYPPPTPALVFAGVEEEDAVLSKT